MSRMEKYKVNKEKCDKNKEIQEVLDILGPVIGIIAA